MLTHRHTKKKDPPELDVPSIDRIWKTVVLSIRTTFAFALVAQEVVTAR